MSEYTVQPGDCLSSIAAAFGYADQAVIYEHADNAELRKLRPDPNVLLPGDVVHIPDPQPDTYRLQTGKAHKLIVKRPPTRLRLALEVDEETHYELVFGDERIAGKVQDATPFEHPIPVDVAEAQLSIWPVSEDSTGVHQTWTLRLGHLDPIEEDSGVLGRLMNLGYYDGDVAKPDPADKAGALRRFQADAKLEVTGALDADTRDALKQRHDG